MRKPFKVCKDIYQIGGADMSHPHDCSVYLLDAGDLVLIDAGAGDSFERLVDNIRSLDLDPAMIKSIVVTHAHIDHIGALKQFQDTYGAQVIAHEIDAEAIERGTGVAAEVYGVDYIPCRVDIKVRGDGDTLRFGGYDMNIIHIPGHTPGSIAAYIDIEGSRVLFGQDIHGPYYRDWGADPELAKASLRKLIDLKADILCEGHFGIYRPASAVEDYIRGYMERL